ncbi:MAG: FtsW/RodA/SpoVE family cell cycle protein [Flavobacteriales bacterium]
MLASIKKPNLHFKGDKIIWIMVAFMSVLSLLVVYSSTGTLAFARMGGNTEHFILKHSIIVMSGLFLMYGVHLANYRIFSGIGILALIIAIPMLLFTLITGTNINDANRWLTIPVINATFQTSDFAKLALVMYLARMLSKRQDTIKGFKEAFVPLMIPVFIVCGLILPANFSTAALLFSVCLVMMFIGRVNLKYILLMIGGFALAFTVFVAIALNTNSTGRIGTWKNRIESFKNGDSEGNFQAEQSKIAIANGGILGRGPGNSIQRNFLPHPYSDFIYAIVIEEYGLIGGLVVMLFYVILLLRVVRICIHAKSYFQVFLAIGCCLLLIFQAMINMAVAVNLFPVTGQSLPLISMGGTSIWFTSIAIGIILSISRNVWTEDDEENNKKNEAGNINPINSNRKVKEGGDLVNA